MRRRAHHARRVGQSSSSSITRITRVRLPPAYFSICTSTGKRSASAARGSLVVEQERLAVAAAHVGPDAGLVLHFDLELGWLHA